MKEGGSSLLPAFLLILIVACTGVAAYYFLGTGVLVSALIGFVCFFVLLKIGDIISELSRDKKYDSDIQFIFTQSCKKCGERLKDRGQVYGQEPPFKVHCNACEHDAFVNEHYEDAPTE